MSCCGRPTWPAFPTNISSGYEGRGCPANLASTSRIRQSRTLPRGSRRHSRGGRSCQGEFEAWFRYVLQRGTSPNGVFGAKMMWNYLEDFKARMAELPGLEDLSFNERLSAVFPRLKIIFMRRRDKVAQAVSLWKAIQTQRWRTDSESDLEEIDVGAAPNSEYDYAAIEYLLNELHRWDARWEDWFHATGREPIRIFYDEFTASRAATIGRVLDALGIDPPAPEGKGPMQRQADDLSKDWVVRFRADREQRQQI